MGEILIVDDDPTILRGYSKVLRGAGFAVETASDGREAASRYRAARYDVIVSDIAMPEMSGVELVRSVREYDLDVPVILATGDPSLETAISAVEYGAFGYLRKPVAAEALVAVVTRAIRLHGLAKLKREALTMLDEGGMQLGDRASLEARFGNALQTMWMAFQPVVSFRDRRIVGYEAFLRSAEPALASAVDFLHAAKVLGRVRDVSRRVHRAVAVAAQDAPPQTLFFVNLHQEDLQDKELFSPDSPLAHIADRVVLEVSERAPIHEMKDVAAGIASLRRLGYRIAIDDLGAGYAGLSCITQLEPEIVKVDMSLVRDIDANATRQSVVQSIAGLCGELDIVVIAEGVETAAERDMLQRLGCNLFQGDVFAKPARGFPVPTWEAAA